LWRCDERKKGETNVDNTTLILVVAFVVLLVAYSLKRRSRLRSDE
jgi:hypothetical protein